MFDSRLHVIVNEDVVAISLSSYSDPGREAMGGKDNVNLHYLRLLVHARDRRLQLEAMLVVYDNLLNAEQAPNYQGLHLTEQAFRSRPAVATRNVNFEISQKPFASSIAVILWSGLLNGNIRRVNVWERETMKSWRQLGRIWERFRSQTYTCWICLLRAWRTGN
jgi:hypothetical protein